MSQHVNVVVVDDDDIDIKAIRRAFASAGRKIVVARDGIEALETLRLGPPERPFVVFLDLRMPRMDGHEFLAALRADPALTDTPVFILTTSSHYQDIERAYAQHVAGYILKERVGRGFSELLALLDQYERVVELPAS